MAESAFPSLQSSGPSSLLMPESLPSLGGREPQFVNASDSDRFQCLLHHGLLQEPQQTKCGHRFCLRCLHDYLGEAKTKPCPVGEPDCEDISGEENHLGECDFEPVACVFTARGCGEKVQRAKVTQHQAACPCRPEVCPACHQEVNHSQMQIHKDSECLEAVVGCPFGCGNKELKRKEVEQHKSQCPVQPVDCKFKEMGCTFSGKREVLERHLKEDIGKHLDLVTSRVTDLQGKTEALAGEAQAERDNLQSMQTSHSQAPQAEVRPGSVGMELRNLKLKMVTFLEKVIMVERKVPELAERSSLQAVEQNITQLRQKITELEQRREREQQQQSSGVSVGAATGAGNVRLGRYNNLSNMAKEVSDHLDTHDRQLSMHDIRLAEMDLRFQLLETAAYDGKLIWKIRDYQRRKQDAVNGRTLSLYSQPFYTNRFGYKLCSRIYLNGDGMGKTTHLSLFFVVMRGEYDALLTWPFRQKVTLTLLDQTPEKRHLTDSFQPDPNSTSFQRPVSEMNVASGCPLFVSHSVLENENNGYLRDDAIFIRILIDETPTSSPF
ncbi:TNF receptor-associated factor 3-like isoform X2 [Babylonia areolata]|uniref:TNF receptor-associated factor 3-like isoform X2 n=1 Tax=Babylonia areolata TaxID=304850 RepID=UPI003FD497C4